MILWKLTEHYRRKATVFTKNKKFQSALELYTSPLLDLNKSFRLKKNGCWSCLLYPVCLLDLSEKLLAQICSLVVRCPHLVHLKAPRNFPKCLANLRTAAVGRTVGRNRGKNLKTPHPSPPLHPSPWKYKDTYNVQHAGSTLPCASRHLETSSTFQNV